MHLYYSSLPVCLPRAPHGPSQSAIFAIALFLPARRYASAGIIIIIFFDPGTQFPRKEKITLCNIKKYKKYYYT